MNRKRNRQMRRDCRKQMAGAIAMASLFTLMSVGIPTVAAWLVGSMTDDLLILNKAAILAQMPPFVCAVLLQVVGAAGLELALNLLLTKKDFAYDSFLMNRFLHLPLKTIEGTDAGTVMERLEEDAAAFCWNQITICAYPAAIALFGGVTWYLLAKDNCPAVFGCAVAALAALPVLRSAWIGEAQTQLKKQLSEYRESRRQMEQELFATRDFAKSYRLQDFFLGRLEAFFRKFLEKTGGEKYRMDARTDAVTFLCDHGVRLGAVLIGAYLVSLGKLTLGTLLTGYLMIPYVSKCFVYLRQWVTEKHDEGKYLDRLGIFYAPEEPEDKAGQRIGTLEADHITFTYADDGAPVFRDLDFHMTAEENCRLTGGNGSGKTTLLSVLAGLYQPQAGQVCGGAAMAVRRENVALQDQNGAVFSGTVWENLFLPESKRQDAAELLKKMGMEKDLDEELLPGGENLSPGERKKILLTRALLRRADFLLLDEPANHLDAGAKAVLKNYLAQRGKGILLISHQEDICKNLRLRTYQLDDILPPGKSEKEN